LKVLFGRFPGLPVVVLPKLDTVVAINFTDESHVVPGVSGEVAVGTPWLREGEPIHSRLGPAPWSAAVLIAALTRHGGSGRRPGAGLQRCSGAAIADRHRCIALQPSPPCIAFGPRRRTLVVARAVGHSAIAPLSKARRVRLPRA
jgi:hypothetical protein